MKTNYLKFDLGLESIDTFLEPVVPILAQGKPIVFPTETVYGVGALMLSKPGLESLFHLKGRGKNKPMAVLVGSLAQVEFLCTDIPPLFYQLAKAFLPGPLTLILKAKPGLPSLVTRESTIAIRFSSHRIAKRLVELAGRPLALTSANISGSSSVINGRDAFAALDGVVETVIDDGNTLHGFESTILSLVDPNKPLLLREGVISRDALELVIGKPCS